MIMIVSYSRLQMLQTWRQCAGLEPSASSCSIERFDGVDVDSRLEAMMRQWYLGLLDEGDRCLVGPPSDASDLVGLKTDQADGHRAVVATDRTLRKLCGIRLSGWRHMAAVVDARQIVFELALQNNKYSRAGLGSPIAWREPTGTVYAAPATAGSTVAEATGYIDTGADSYRIDERALETIPSFINNHQTTTILL